MESKILALREELAARLAAAEDAAALDEVRVAFLGKRGSVTLPWRKRRKRAR